MSEEPQQAASATCTAWCATATAHVIMKCESIHPIVLNMDS